MAARTMIFGAGKIGRGFLGHLLFRAGHELTFVDSSEAVVAGLRARGGYLVAVLGAPAKDCQVQGVRALWTGERAAVLAAVAEHALFVCAVGGANLPGVGELLGQGLSARWRAGQRGPVNVIICENFQDPAAILRRAILAADATPGFQAWAASELGLVETQVLRSCIEPSAAQLARDPLAVQVQDWWVLPCDRDGFRGPPPSFEGLSPRANFQHELRRKVYTYNCSNATIAYLGWLRGYTMLHEAANDPAILAVTQAVYDESGAGLIAEYGFDPGDQKALQELAISKYRDPLIVDPIERNGRDSRRKLSPDDRLMGPANIALKHGIAPRHLALAVAAGLHYAGSDDPGTRQVGEWLRQRGLLATASTVCGIAPDSLMASLLVEAVPRLAAFNQRGVPLIGQ